MREKQAAKAALKEAEASMKWNVIIEEYLHNVNMFQAVRPRNRLAQGSSPSFIFIVHPYSSYYLKVPVTAGSSRLWWQKPKGSQVLCIWIQMTSCGPLLRIENTGIWLFPPSHHFYCFFFSAIWSCPYGAAAFWCHVIFVQYDNRYQKWYTPYFSVWIVDWKLIWQSSVSEMMAGLPLTQGYTINIVKNRSASIKVFP